MEELIEEFPDGISLPAGRFILQGSLEVPLKYKGQLKITVNKSLKRKLVEWVCESKSDLKLSIPIEDYGQFYKDESVKSGKIYILNPGKENYVPFWLQNMEPHKEEEMVKIFKKIVETPYLNKTQEQPNAPEASTSMWSAAATPPSSAQSLGPYPPSFMPDYYAQPYSPLSDAATDLHAILYNNESTRILLEDDEAVQELMSHLPPELNSYENLLEALNCSQLKHITQNLSQAIYSNQLHTLNALLGLHSNSTSESHNIDPMYRFIRGLQMEYGSPSTTENNQQSDYSNKKSKTEDTEDSRDKSV